MKGIRSKQGEIWVDMFSGYALSNFGRWYSYHTNKIIRQSTNSSGYKRIFPYINGKRKSTFTHIKVVEQFGDCFGNRLPNTKSLFQIGMSIDHIDGNKNHNQCSNLELVTHKENCLRRNRRKKSNGKSNSTTKSKSNISHN